MIEGLFEALGGVTNTCLVLFIVGALWSGMWFIIGLSRGWIVMGATHNEALESLRFFRGKTFEFAALAEAKPRPRHE